MQPIYTIIESYVRELSTKNWDFFNRGCIADKVYSAIRSILSTEDLRKSLSTSQPTSFPALQRTQDRDKSLQLGEELLEKNTDLTDLDYDGNPISPGGQKETNYKEDILDSYAPHYEEPNSKNNVPYEDRAVPMLLKEISEALATNSEDMTAKVKEIATLGNECDNIIWRNANSDIITPNPERQLVKELGYLKNMRNALGRETTRSLPEGMVDRRRLGRIAVTDNIYKVNKRIPMKELDITLLLDRSSSMCKHMKIYDAAEALFAVLGKDIKILSYYSLSDTNIEIHNFDSKYRKIEPVGGTPSGLALLTTAIKYPKTLVIHFTDGDANNTIRPGEALDIIGDKYPSCQIINLLYKAKKELYNSKNPNSSIINLKSVQEFPLKLKKIIEPILRHR
jgi:hypothetical protein